MDIKAVKFRKDGFYSQPFAFGGEEGQEKFDKNRHWRRSHLGRYRPACRLPRWCNSRRQATGG